MNVVELGERTLLETDVRLVEPLRLAFDKYLFGEQVNMANRVGQLHRLTLHGPGAAGLLQELGGPVLFPMKGAGFPALGPDAAVFRDDVAGVPGFHLVVPSATVADLWSRLLQFSAATELGKRRLRPAGWAAFNACRIEAGRPLFGIDFEGAPVPTAYPARKQREEEAADAPAPGVLPAETGQLLRAVSFTKGCYLGQEIVARMYARGQVARQIVGIRFETDHLPIAGAPVLDDQMNAVGVITSSTVSPLLSNQAVCLGYVKKPFMTPGSKVRVPAEGEVRAASVVTLPFVRPGDFPPPADRTGA
jgi:folate-binding protein YgfZ